MNAVAAAIRDVDPNLLAGRDWALRRRNVVVASSVALILAVLLVAVAAGAVQLAAALSVARSRELAATARIQPLPDALLTAAAAWREHETREAESSLIELMHRFPTLREHVLQVSGGSVASIGLVRGGLYVAADAALVQVRIGGPTTLIQVPGDADAVAVASDSALFGIGDAGLWTVDVHGARPVAPFEFPVALSATADAVAVAVADGTVSLVDRPTAAVLRVHRHAALATAVAIDANWVCSAALGDPPVLVTDRRTRATRALPEPPFSSANGVAVQGGILAIAFEDGVVGTWELPSLTARWMERVSGTASAAALTSDGALVAFSTNDGEVDVFEVEDGDLVDRFSVGPGGRGLGARLVEPRAVHGRVRRLGSSLGF